MFEIRHWGPQQDENAVQGAVEGDMLEVRADEFGGSILVVACCQMDVRVSVD